MLVSKRLDSLRTGGPIQPIAQLCQHVIEVAVFQILHRRHHLGRTPPIEQLSSRLSALEELQARSPVDEAIAYNEASALKVPEALAPACEAIAQVCRTISARSKGDAAAVASSNAGAGKS